MKKNGFTLIEIIITLAAGLIVMMSVAMLLQSGYQSWNKTYNTANAESRIDSIGTTTAFGSIGRKSNKKDYYVYQVAGSTYTAPPLNLLDPDEILRGQAVEFRYWSSDLEDNMLTPTSVANKYALFYLEDGELKLDTGPSTGGPHGGAINTAGHRVASVTTVTLAKHVTSVEFSHTKKTPTGGGLGCVRMKLIINDPADKESKTIIAATYLRNVWPQ